LGAVPLITQVEVLIDKPCGRAGVMVQFVMVVPPALREEGVILIAF
jgi:hypothetical protein